MLVDYRNNDAVLTICQNNKAGSITISEANEPVKELTGYSPDDLAGRPLQEILPQRIAGLLSEYVEFENDSNDVGSVLSKVQSFSIISKSGREKAYRIKIARIRSLENSSFFSLVLQDTLGTRKNEAANKIIQENFKGHESLDPRTGLPNRASLIKDIAIIKHHSRAKGLLSCFALLQVDGYDKLMAEHGRAVCEDLLKYVASIAGRSMRPDDVVGSAGDGRIGILLVDIARGSGRLVLNRLRWQIASNPYTGANKQHIGLSVSISFCLISADIGDKEVVERCEAALGAMDNGVANMLFDVSGNN
jgi:PAS domain S-box-containing protein